MDLLIRDAAMTIAIFGFFASCWFGWAREKPPATWKTPLMVAAIAGVTVAVAGGIGAWLTWDTGSVMAFGTTAFRIYTIVVGIEFALGALGSGVLVLLKKADYIPAWICLVVGTHFYALAPVLENPGLYVLATVLTLVALVSIPVARRRDLTISAVVGVSTGSSLLAFVAWTGIAVAL